MAGIENSSSPSSPQPTALRMGGTAQPLPTLWPGPYLRYSLSSLLAVLSGKVRYEELVFLTRGSRSPRSMAVSGCGAAGAAALGADAGAAQGKGRKRQLKAKGERLPGLA